MNDRNLGMILATVIAAPVVVICCGGGLALVGPALAGLVGLFSGMGGGLSGLLAIGVGVLLFAMFGLRSPKDDCGRSDTVSEPRS